MSLATAYRVIAPFYDWAIKAPLDRARGASLASVPRTGALDILIDGAGTGLDLPHLPSVHRYVATDLVMSMLARARPRIGTRNCSLVLADSMRLPFRASSFDMVVLHLIVAVVDRPVVVLQEAARVTRDHGRLVILDKFLRAGDSARLRRRLSPIAARFATRLDVVFEEVLAQVPALRLVSDEPAFARGWFRRIVLERAPRAGDCDKR